MAETPTAAQLVAQRSNECNFRNTKYVKLSKVDTGEARASSHNIREPLRVLSALLLTWQVPETSRLQRPQVQHRQLEENDSLMPETSEKRIDKRARKGLVITVSGPHGTGKSTYARALAKALGLRYVCAGELFRNLARENRMSLESYSRYAAGDPRVDKMIDERTRAEAAKGSVVIDAQLGAWMAKDEADVRLLLVAPDEVRFGRIARRDHVSFEVAKKDTLEREQIQKERYKKYYDVDVEDLSIYDLKIDTGDNSINTTKRIIIDSVRRLLEQRNQR